MIPTDSAAFRRLVLEAAAIVGSILLAFAIDAWWDEFQDSVDTRENLVDVRMEFLEYEAELERRYELHGTPPGRRPLGGGSPGGGDGHPPARPHVGLDL